MAGSAQFDAVEVVCKGYLSYYVDLFIFKGYLSYYLHLVIFRYGCSSISIPVSCVLGEQGGAEQWYLWKRGRDFVRCVVSEARVAVASFVDCIHRHSVSIAGLDHEHSSPLFY